MVELIILEAQEYIKCHKFIYDIHKDHITNSYIIEKKQSTEYITCHKFNQRYTKPQFKEIYQLELHNLLISMKNVHRANSKQQTGCA